MGTLVDQLSAFSGRQKKFKSIAGEFMTKHVIHDEAKDGMPMKDMRSDSGCTCHIHPIPNVSLNIATFASAL